MNLSKSEREELEGLQRKRTAEVALVRRAKLILLLDAGASRGAVMNALNCDSRFITTWRSRFTKDRLAGLRGRYPGRAPRPNLPQLEARVLDYTLKRKPQDGSTHWSSRKLATELGISFMDVQRIWRRHDLKPHRVDRHMVSNDPDCEVVGKTAARHTSAQFVAFLNDVLDSQPKGREIRVICDNVSSHKTAAVAAFLAEHSNVSMHFTPTYSSWLNQVENWFGRIQRDVLARGISTSTTDLHNELLHYIRQYNKNAKPLKWKYADPSRRIQSNPSVSVG